MTERAQPKRTITQLTKTTGWGGSCSYHRSRPFKMCSQTAEYLMTVETAGSGSRKPFTMRYRYCAEHVPWHKIAPPTTAAERPVGRIGAQEAADLIGVPIMTLHKWRGRGKGPKSVKVKGRCWYERSEVEQFADAFRLVNGE